MSLNIHQSWVEGHLVISPEPHSRERSRRRYSFGEFTLDLEGGALTRGGEEITLRPKSFEVLTYLVEHHGQLVTKSALVEAIWPDTAVGDNSLAQCLFDIRRALGDDSQQLIRTVARRGYVFAGSVTTPVAEFPRDPGPLPVRPPPRSNRRVIIAAVALPAIAIVAIILLSVRRSARQELTYTQLTNFTDSAVSPALSPDGRMLGFIRSEYTFGGPGQIYVKLLPNGEPAQLTHDDLNKRGSPKFSPDGTRLAYAALKPGSGWNTWVVPVLGGQPRPFLANASGLTWIESGGRQPRLLFSELTGRGGQMAIVSSTESRAQHRTVYMPPETGMAHRSYISPDRKQVLLVEMDRGSWLPCRLMPFDGSTPGKPVGPAPAHCTEAAWSPDGKWMYFSTDTGNGFHIWRQRFPDGAPQQTTFGVTQEEGIEFAPDGRSFVTSIGASQSSVWFHDSRGDRQITSEGYGFLPSVSPDGKKLYYLLRAGPRHFGSGELWVADLESGQRQRLLPDFEMQHYAISADGQRVAFVASDDAGRSPAWLAALNGQSAPRQISANDARKAYFGAGGYVFLRSEENGARFAYRVKEDGSELQKIVRIDAPTSLFSASPDGKWIVIPGSTDEMTWPAMVYPVGGGSPKLLCVLCDSSNDVERTGSPAVSWSPDGKFLYLKFQEFIYAIPLRPGQMLPPIPASGFRSKDDVAALPGARLIPERGAFPGPNPSIYAFTKVATHRNIYRVPVP
jgi:Tol biopolymer transport system component/DNA-binding winged helix-turn-helix (wHTH) protein